MSSEFDPYLKWLGIESDERPPNHYELLGLKDLEDKNEVINAASIKRVERIQDIASGGQHSELSQRILNEIAAARICFCLLYTSPSPRDQRGSRMPSSA